MKVLWTWPFEGAAQFAPDISISMSFNGDTEISIKGLIRASIDALVSAQASWQHWMWCVCETRRRSLPLCRALAPSTPRRGFPDFPRARPLQCPFSFCVSWELSAGYLRGLLLLGHHAPRRGPCFLRFCSFCFAASPCQPICCCPARLQQNSKKYVQSAVACYGPPNCKLLGARHLGAAAHVARAAKNRQACF